MEEKVIKIRMLGTLSVSLADNTVSCSGNRSKRVWNLLAYLFYHRKKTVSSEDITDLLWNNNTSESPRNAMKTTLHRARALLDSLSPGLGHEMILFSSGGYSINPNVAITVDVEEFDSLLGSLSEDKTIDNLAIYEKALSLYSGDFMNVYSSESWIIPIQAYYHNLYVSAVEKFIPMLEKAGKFDDGVRFCKAAIHIDQYYEPFYQLLMRCLLQLDERQEVVTVYEDMSKILLSTFGVMPDKESRSLYREALKTVNTKAVSPDVVTEQLAEIGVVSGALLCDYDFFRTLYQAKARMIARSGDVIHIALISLRSRSSSEVSARSIELAMDNLEKHMSASLRKGDVIARCSASQFVIMLPQANFENSCAVCQRFIDSFERKYPHSPVRVDYFVHAVNPSTDN